MARRFVKIEAPKAVGGSAKALRVLMIASEAQPFSKTGGLADVAGALPKALGRLGHDVTLVTPRYRGVTDGPVVGTVSIEVAAHRFVARLMDARPGKTSRTLLLDCPELYDRDGIYYNARGDFDDNAVRYAVLSAAAIEWAIAQAPFDIVHSHDWQGGLASVYTRRLPQASTVFTIHNLAYQGIFDKSWVPRLGLRWEDFTINGFHSSGSMPLRMPTNALRRARITPSRPLPYSGRCISSA